MAEFIPLMIIDLQLDPFIGDAVHVCAGQPTTYTEAATTFQLATEAVTSPDFVKANGDVSGRKQTCTPGADTTIVADGLADHVAVTNGTTLLDVYTCTNQGLTSGGTVSVSPFDHEVGAPS